MSSDTVFLRANVGKVLYALRSKVNGHDAPNVTLISSDKVEVKGHSNILVTCPYFRELFERDEAKNLKSKLKSKQGFDEGLPGDVLELMIKYIYTGEYSLLNPEKLPEVLRATSEEKYNIPELAKDYLLEQFDAPGGLTKANWHLFYKNGIKLRLEEEYFNRIYAFLKEEHPEFYKREEFKDLTYEQIYKMIKSPNHPFASTTIMEAFLLWTTENKVGKDKLTELGKICTNLIQNGNPSPQIANSPILDTSVHSANGSLSTQDCPQPTILSDPHCSSTTKKRTISISPQIDTNLNSKRSNMGPNLNDIAANSTETSIMSSPPHHSDSGSRSATLPQPQSVPKSNPSTSTATTISSMRANSLENGSSNLNKRSNMVEVYHPPKYSWDSAQLLFFGQAEESEPRYLWSYSFHTGEMKKIAKLPHEEIVFSSLLVSQDHIYSIGGISKHKGEHMPQDLVRSFSIRDLENLDKAWENVNKIWDEKSTLNRAIFLPPILLFRNTIYLFLGLYKPEIEKWDMDGNPGIWEYNILDILYDRICLGVALLDNTIYMVGGFGAKKGETNCKTSALESAEIYNIDDGTPTLLPNMNQARSNLRVVALKDRIYAIGGEVDNHEELRSVESYKPGDASWTQVAQMNQPRAGGSAFVLDDMIYVIGGNWGEPTMERYCPQEDRWTMVDIKNIPKCAYLSSSALLGPNNF